MGLSLRGTTSGAVDINAPAVAGDNTITLPGNNGAANQFYKNSGTAGTLTYSTMLETSSGLVSIGGTVQDENNDIDVLNTKLTIKQSANNIEDGIYIERAGERRGYYIRVGNVGNLNDSLIFGNTQLGTITDTQLALDRSGNVVMNSGNVGIGTDNPSDELSVVSSLTTDSVLRLQGGNSAGKGSGIRLMRGASAVGYIGPESWLFGGSNTSNTLVISQNAQANLSITSAGLVGIGLTNPGHKLEVQSGGNGTFFISGKSSTGVDIFKVYESSNGDGNHGMLYLQNGSDVTKIKLSTNGVSYFNGGNVGIGTDNPAMRLCVKGAVTAGGGSNEDLQQWNIGSDNVKAEIKYIDASADRGMLFGTTTDHNLSFQCNNTERMRITNEGKVRIGNGLTSAAGELFQVIRDGGGQGTNDCLAYFETGQNDWIQKLYFNASGTAYFFDLQQQGTRRGAVFYDGTMNYSDGSDYRLKENVVPLVNAIDRVKQLQPCTYNFIEHGPEKEYDGFLAHELAEVCPYAVKGEKDAVNEDGSPDIQVIDRSHVIPLLSAALQEAITKIETLETQNADLLSRVTALEG